MNFDFRKTGDLKTLQELSRTLRRSKDDIPIKLVCVKPTDVPICCMISDTCPGIHPVLSESYLRKAKVETKSNDV